MRKTYPYSIFFVLLLLAGACKEDEDDIDPHPNVSFFPQDHSRAFEGDTIAFSFNVSSPEDLQEVLVFKSLNGGAESPVDTFSLSSFQVSLPYEYVVTESTAGTVVSLRFEATDVKGFSNSATYTIDVLGLLHYPDVHFEYPSDSSSLSFYSVPNAQVVDFDAADANPMVIDWMYLYDAPSETYAGMYAIIDPVVDAHFQGINFWTFRQQTLFKPSVLTAAEFDALTASDVPLVVDDAMDAAATGIDNLEVDDVVVFKTHDERHGIFKVTALQPGMGEADFIEIAIWIQEER